MPAFSCFSTALLTHSDFCGLILYERDESDNKDERNSRDSRDSIDGRNNRDSRDSGDNRYNRDKMGGFTMVASSTESIISGTQTTAEIPTTETVPAISERSKVYFTNMRAKARQNMLQKLQKLITAAGFDTIDFNYKYVALKIHFGEPGNLSFLRPNYAKVIVDEVTRLGGKPFLTDCNTLYVGRRKNALEHIDAAYENGYNPFSTGCHVIIADGLKGTDEVLVPINGEHVKEAKIGRAIMDADIIISLNHFKGHELTGFGGAVKNLGMGCGSRAGKMEMHNAGKPFARKSACIGCRECMKVCAQDAISMQENKAVIDTEKCAGCGRCLGICLRDAIKAPGDESNTILCKKIAEYTHAVIKGRPHFHINFVMDVSPFCDCHAESDTPIIPNVGIFASFDPVALDVACADACNKQPVISGSYLDKPEDEREIDHFATMHPVTHWEDCLEHAEKLGVGNQAYELQEIL